MRRLTYLLLIAFLALFTSTLQANIIHVPADSSTIQGGINAAVYGDTVMVSPGLYFESRIDFFGKAIVVMSTNPLDDAVVAATIVDGSSNGSVFYFQSGEEINSILAGFTIRNGHGYGGGGILISGASPTITRNIISDNSAVWGGGGITIADSHAIVSHNIITRNTIVDEYEQGGGIRIYGANPIISNNVISENTADYGGGIYCDRLATPIISENTVINNTAWKGGGIHCYEYSYVTVSNTIFWGNSAPIGRQIYLGSGSWEASNIFSIDYSNVEGGEAGVFLVSWDVLNWGDGMLDTPPEFSGDGYHLTNDSPMRNVGDPDFTGQGESDIDEERRVIEGRVDIGADEIRVMHIRDDNPPVIDMDKEAKAVE
ncbi:MAG: right-handed parallel beta-helix repeat-containing protein [Planctomycetota bacterium]|jgi:hypothetical protein